MLTPKDLEQIMRLGIDQKVVESQIEHFKNGFPSLDILAIATTGTGILNIDEKEAESLIRIYNDTIPNRQALKFVPASGAASRMFKELFYFISEEDIPSKLIIHFIDNIEAFAFYDDLKKVMITDGLDIKKCIADKNFKLIINYLITAKGLNYGEMPKGLLKFHPYPDHSRTAIEEHMVEGADYCRDRNGKVCLHFTVSPEHKNDFTKFINHVKARYEKGFNVTYEITFSIQEHSTDTIAVGLDNKPFREKDGSLLFRPGGHGALLNNLYHLKGDIVFIKNVDNVTTDRLKPEIFHHAKILGGYLLLAQSQTFGYLKILENKNIAKDKIAEIAEFAEKKLLQKIDANFNDLPEQGKIKYLFEMLNRPIRVCSMVKNEGHAGGGPFWVKNNNGKILLQIVESQQINMNDPHQKNIFERSTHFSPTDIVCGMRDYKGNHFDLKKYVDPSTGFISQKSKDGKDLKAMELPGLWNGSMADWISIFIEVPVATFNPVKTVFDLLKKEHRN